MDIKIDFKREEIIPLLSLLEIGIKSLSLDDFRNASMFYNLILSKFLDSTNTKSIRDLRNILSSEDKEIPNESVVE